MAAIARTPGLSTEQLAQQSLELANTLASERIEAALADLRPGGAGWQSNLDAWRAETLADATLGATPEERTAAIQRGVNIIDRFEQANPAHGAAMKKFLTDTGLGNKREVAHFFAWFGRVAGEPQTLGGPLNDNAGERSAAQRMYGPDGPKQK